jgi:type IV secretory pathway protease TraF
LTPTSLAAVRPAVQLLARELREPAFRSGKQLGAEDLWLLGLDPEVSWDSRYFGAISIENVRASANPVWTLAPPSGDQQSTAEAPAVAPRDRDVP